MISIPLSSVRKGELVGGSVLCGVQRNRRSLRRKSLLRFFIKYIGCFFDWSFVLLLDAFQGVSTLTSSDAYEV